MIKRALIVALTLAATPCLAVDLRDTMWYGQGELTVTMAGQSQSEWMESVIVFMGTSPKKGTAALGDLPCKWTSKSVSSPSFTLIPLKAAAEMIAQGVRDQLPGAKVNMSPQPMQGSASLQTGTIVYGVRFKVSVKYMGEKAKGFVTVSQSGFQITTLAAGAQRQALLSAVSRAIAAVLDK